MNKPYRYLLPVIVLLLLLTTSPVPGESRTADQDEIDTEASATAPEQPADQLQRVSADPDRPFQVEFDIIPRIESGKLFFDVTANLPDGMIFLATIVDDMGIINSADTTLERAHTVIEDGRMIIGPFPSWDKPFPSGEYTLYLNSLPIAQQPPSVISIIGRDGKNLNGQYVVKGSIIFVKTFMVTGAARSR